RGSDAAIAPCQDPFQQTGLDVVLDDAHRTNTAQAAQVVPGPAQVVLGLHAIPLVRRVRLGDEVGNGGGDVDVAADRLLADLGNGFGHFHNAVEVHSPFAGPAAHDTKLQAAPRMQEADRGALVKVRSQDFVE